MNGDQVETEENYFNCVVCGHKITVDPNILPDLDENPENQTVNVTCPNCSAEYKVGKNEAGEGLIVTFIENAEPEIVDQEINDDEY